MRYKNWNQYNKTRNYTTYYIDILRKVVATCRRHGAGGTVLEKSGKEKRDASTVPPTHCHQVLSGI